MTDTKKENSGETGRLFICATPIGNLDDITYRVVKTLEEADLIAAEDTRVTRGLLAHLDIHTPLTSYHEYNKTEKARELVEKMKQGLNVALVTDAGTPAISDPGEELVRQCAEAGIELTSLPGPSALITALTVSGLSTRRFCFEGFLSEDRKDRQEIYSLLEKESRTIVLYESPHNLKRTVMELYAALGNRKLSVCRELTKVHEEVRRTTLEEETRRLENEEPRGEYVLVIEGRGRKELKAEEQARWEKISIEDHMAYYREEGMDEKMAMKQVAKDRGVPRSEIYRVLKVHKANEMEIP